MARFLLLIGVMPSLEHEAIVEVVRSFPDAVRDLVGAHLGVELARVRSRVADPDSTEIVPTEFRADGLLVFGDPAEYGFVVEVQRQPDEAKRRTWPLYGATAHADLCCPVWVVVIATNRRTAAWARRPIGTFQPGTNYAPVVLGPEEIPRVTDSAAAQTSPGLGLLSAIVHGHDPGGEIVAVAAVDGLVAVEEDRATLFFKFLQGILDEVVFAAVEAHMQARDIPYRIPFARDAYEKGNYEALQRALLRILDAKLRTVPPQLRERVEARTDSETLETWLEQIACATDEDAVHAVFDD